MSVTGRTGELMVNLAPLTPEQCAKIRALATEPNPDDLLGMGEDYFGADIVLALLDTIDQLRETK